MRKPKFGPLLRLAAALALPAWLAAAPAAAACLSDAQAQAFVRDWEARRPVANPEGLSETEASCSRVKLNYLLTARLGAPVGYKAGLTNPAVQQLFKASEPVWGALYPGMLLPDGSVVPAAFGARPVFEADLLVRVKSADIHQARTPQEVMQHIDQIIPFIELPDLAVNQPSAMDGRGLAAINVGARLGVQGVPIAVPGDAAGREALLQGLAAMTVRVNDLRANAELSRGQGADVLGHPLNAVVWLAQALDKDGLSLQPGQVISLGSFSPLTPPQPGQSVMVSYDGLPGAQPVVASFR